MLPEQIVVSLPADTLAAALIVKFILSLMAVHIPDGSSVVNINETEPASISFAEGV